MPRADSPFRSAARLAIPSVCLALVALVAIPGTTLASAGRTPSSSVRFGASPHAGAAVPLSGHYPVAFILCNFSEWHYAPNSIAYYKKLWTTQSKPGVFSSLADFFHDVSFGQMDLQGSAVLGWYHMSTNLQNWYEGGNGNRVPVRWLDCVNAAEAGGANLSKYRALVAVTPYVQARITGSGLPAQPALQSGQKTPPPVKMSVDSTSGWPPAPFLMTVPTPGAQYGENVHVTAVSGNTMTLTRGFNEGVSQLPGPFPAVPAGGKVVLDSDDDFALVGPDTVYSAPGAQPCSNGKGRCPKISLSAPAGTHTSLNVGVANLFAGDDLHDGNVTAGVGDSAHEVGHTTGYQHSRVLSSSTTDYNDCYDQMSYNACGLPGFPGEAGPQDGVLGYDAIDLEFHGWIPKKAIFNDADQALKQTTLTLHALSDPNALRSLKGAYLDAHIPSHVQIEDVSPKNINPTIPPTCSGSGYHCTTSQYLTVEYRQRYGFDQSLREESVNTPCFGVPPVGAVVLHLYAPPDPANSGGNISWLVDSYPGKSVAGKPVFLPHCAALQPGDDYADPSHDTYVAVNSFSKATFTAKVTIGSSPIRPTLAYTGSPVSYQGQSETLSARLSVGGAPVPGQQVSFAMGADDCGPVLTDATGAASCKVTDSLSPGSHTVVVSSPGDAVYDPTTTKSNVAVWTPQSQTTGKTDLAPALASYDGDLYAAWTNQTGSTISYASYDGTSWSPAEKVAWSGGGALTNLGPALAVYKGDLYAAWTDQSNDDVDYSTFNGSAWTPEKHVTGSWGTAATNTKPSLAIFDGDLYAGWKGRSTDRIGYSAYNGSSWAPQVLLSITTDDAPAMVGDPSNGSLVIAWTGSDSRVHFLYCCVEPTFTVPQAKTHASPALAFIGPDSLYFAWKGATTNLVFYEAAIDGSFAAQASEPQAKTDQEPGITAAGTTLSLGWKGLTTFGIFFAQSVSPP